MITNNLNNIGLLKVKIYCIDRHISIDRIYPHLVNRSAHSQ